jgi:heme/copper-type cytochrome/quinol oxidase subunit 1
VTIALADLVNGLSEDVVLRPGGSSPVGIVALNLLAVAGSALLVVGLLVTVAAIAQAWFGRRAGRDPWGGNTLEWTTSSPPPPANFAEPVATVRSAHPLLDRTEA